MECNVCGEPLVLNSRVCSHCLYNAHFSVVAQCVVSPLPYLGILQGYLTEMLNLRSARGLMDRERLHVKEILASFEVVESVAMISFADNADVCSAISQIYDLVDTVVKERKSRIRRNRILLLAAVVLLLLNLFTAPIFS